MNIWISEEEKKTKTYEDGLKDAWELAKKINCTKGEGVYSSSELNSIFYTFDNGEIMADIPLEEVIAKIEAYEKRKKEIKAGDIVRRIDDGARAFVIDEVNDEMVFIFSEYECVEEVHKNNLVKTGNRIAMEIILNTIRSE